MNLGELVSGKGQTLTQLSRNRQGTSVEGVHALRPSNSQNNISRRRASRDRRPQDTDLVLPGFVVRCVRIHSGLTSRLGMAVVTAVVKILLRPWNAQIQRREQAWAVVKSVWQSIVFWVSRGGPLSGRSLGFGSTMTEWHLHCSCQPGVCVV